MSSFVIVTMTNQLSEALKNNYSSKRVEELLHLYPNAAEVEKDKSGWMPLHVALKKKASPDIITMIFKAFPKAAEVRDSWGSLPLHCALLRLASVDVINVLLKAYPEAAEVPMIGGWLPLHYALLQEASKDVINMLYKAYPKAVQVQNEYGNFPLHYACTSQFYLRDSSLEVLNLLIAAYPEGIDAKDREDKLPSDYLKDAISDENGTEHLYLLHAAVIGGFSTSLVKLLLQAFPESCMQKDNDGKVPLHHACASRATNFFEVVMALLHADEGSKNIVDNQGRTPMQVLKCTASHQDENKMLLLHHLAASSDCLTEESVLFLVNANPDSIRTPDKYDMLPFHHACLNRALSLDVLMLFVSLYPEGVKIF
jgi:ankyrin repeat protein